MAGQNPDDINMAWAQWVRDKRKASGKSRAQLAREADIHNSYWTLIERDGYVPRRAKVLRIGMLFGDTLNACLVTGLTPPEISGQLIKYFQGKALLPKTMPDDINEHVMSLCEAEEYVRRQVVAVTKPLLEPVESKPRRTRSTK